jgi:proline dehydrogenase
MLTRAIRDLGNFLFLNVLNRWVAGAKAEDAINYCQSLKTPCVIHYLGEAHTEIPHVMDTVNEYKRVIDLISKNKLKAHISIKPTQFGFNALEKEDSEKFCSHQMLEVIKYASSKKILTWLDMEYSEVTDFTIKFYRRFASKYKLGITLQANLKRTEKDLVELAKFSQKTKVKVRLVKGAYHENDELVLSDSHEIHVKYLGLISIAFEQTNKDFGIVVASHHTQALELAQTLQKTHKKKFFELEILKGVIPNYSRELRKNGVPLIEYVPYGEHVFAYSIRRADKKPKYANSIFLVPFFDAYKKLYK